jgi:PAS domain S-box-containing protein
MMRILLVDDERDLADIAKLFLEMDGDMDVTTARSGREAMALLKGADFDAVVSDYQMPGMNGIEFLRKVRESDQRMPFILFTGRGREEVVIEALNSGATFYLQKGGHAEAQFIELEHKIREAVKSRLAEDELLTTNMMLRAAMDQTKIAYWIFDVKSRCIRMNEQAWAILRTRAEDEGGDETAVSRMVQEFIVKEDVEEVHRALGPIVDKSDASSGHAEFRVKRRDGEVRTVSLAYNIGRDPAGAPFNAVGVIQDITEQREAERRLRRLNRELLAIKEVNEAIARARSEQELLESTCRIACSVGGYALAWIGFLQEGEEMLVRPAAWAGFNEDFVTGLNITARPEGRGLGPSGECVRSGRTAYVQDCETDPRIGPWREQALRNGYRSSISIPITIDGRTIGCAALYSNQPNGFTEEEGGLLEEMVKDLTYGIASQRTQSELRSKTGELESFFEVSADLLGISSPKGVLLHVNSAWLKSLGYGHDEIEGRKFMDLVLPEDVDGTMSIMKDLLDGKNLDGFVNRYVCRDGSVRWIEWTAVLHDGLVFAAGRDVTERKRIEAALQQMDAARQTQSAALNTLNRIVRVANSSTDLSNLFSDVLKDVLMEFGLDGGGIYVVNQQSRMAELVHHSGLPSELVKMVREVSIDDERFRNLFVNGEAAIMGMSGKMAGEHSSHTEMTSMASAPLVSNNEVVGALVVGGRQRALAHDELASLVTIGREIGSSVERMRAVDAYRSAALDLDGLFNSMNEMVFILGVDGKIVAVNTTVEQKLHYTASELEGTNVLALHVPERRDEALAIVKGMIAGTIDACPVPVMTKEGERVQVETRVTMGRWKGREVLIGVSRDITERARAYERLERSEREYRLLAENINDVIWKLDLATLRFTYMSPSIERLRGYTVEEAMQETLIDSIGEEAFRQIIIIIKERMDRLMAGDAEAGYYTGVVRQRHKNGGWVDVEVAANVLTSADGVPAEILGVSRDATKRVRSEEELRQKTEELERFFEVTLDLLCIADAEGRIVRANHMWEEGGYLPADLRGRRFTELVDPEDEASMMAVMRDVSSQKRVLGHVSRCRAGNGEARLLEWRFFPCGGAIYAAAQDITERRRAEVDLRKSEAQIKAIILSMNDLIFVLNEELVFEEYYQPRTEDLFIPPESFVGRRIDAVGFPQPAFGVVMDAVDRTIRTGQPSYAVYYLDLPKGRTCFDVHVTRRLDANRASAGVTCVVRDITEQKNAEEALRQAGRKLNILNEITRHDVLNQVTGIRGNAALLQRKALEPEVERHVAKIDEAAKAIQWQMEFTRDYQDIGDKAPAWQSLHGCVRAAKGAMSLGNLNVSTGEEDYLIRADPMFEKVVYNMIDNCLRHSGGADRMDVTAVPCEGKLLVTFRDNGNGMSPEEREHCFDRGHGKNTGFGLFLSREVLGITGMTIEERGAQGTGAAFEIAVPAGDWKPAGRVRA